MDPDYRSLLEATIRHVEWLKERGVRRLVVSRESLNALAKPPPTTNASVRPPAQAPTPMPAPKPKASSALASPAATTSTPSLPASLVSAPLSREDREIAWEQLRARVLPCTRCPHLATARRNVVFGVGDIHSPLLFVGEAPGADEDEQGEPFVGRAGQLLTRIIETMGLSRRTVYIANILKCRPDTPGQSSGNRKPTPEEMQTCLPYLLEQVGLMQPKVIVALGVTAIEGLLGKTLPITRVRGTWLEFQGIPLMPTYHPAYLLRNQSITEKRKVWEDMLLIMERLQMPISEKQRGFFLKS